MYLNLKTEKRRRTQRYNKLSLLDSKNKQKAPSKTWYVKGQRMREKKHLNKSSKVLHNGCSSVYMFIWFFFPSNPFRFYFLLHQFNPIFRTFHNSFTLAPSLKQKECKQNWALYEKTAGMCCRNRRRRRGSLANWYKTSSLEEWKCVKILTVQKESFLFVWVQVRNENQEKVGRGCCGMV